MANGGEHEWWRWMAMAEEEQAATHTPSKSRLFPKGVTGHVICHTQSQFAARHRSPSLPAFAFLCHRPRRPRVDVVAKTHGGHGGTGFIYGLAIQRHMCEEREVLRWYLR